MAPSSASRLSEGKLARLVLGVASLALFAACTTVGGAYGPVNLRSPFWKQPPRQVDIVLLAAPAGDVYRTGGDEVLHELITKERDRELMTVVSESQPDYEWLVDRFAALFAERGFPVSRLDADDLEIGSEGGSDALSAYFDGDLGSEPPYRLKPEIAANRKPELLLVIIPGAWGISRLYEFGAIPIGPHHATFGVIVELWDIPNRMKLWSDEASGSTAIPRQWNEPPEHPKVHSALESALQACGDGAIRSLEMWRGSSAELVYSKPAQAEK